MRRFEIQSRIGRVFFSRARTPRISRRNCARRTLPLLSRFSRILPSSRDDSALPREARESRLFIETRYCCVHALSPSYPLPSVERARARGQQRNRKATSLSPRLSLPPTSLYATLPSCCSLVAVFATNTAPSFVLHLHLSSRSTDQLELVGVARTVFLALPRLDSTRISTPFPAFSNDSRLRDVRSRATGKPWAELHAPRSRKLFSYRQPADPLCRWSFESPKRNGNREH